MEEMVIFDSNQTIACIESVGTIDDSTAEDDETFYLCLEPVTNHTFPGDKDIFTVVIKDNDSKCTSLHCKFEI